MFHQRLATLLAFAPLALPSATLAHIRLAGEFLMTGRITAAHAVAGEHVGDTVIRTWNFVAPCPADQCQTEQLVRSRAVGGDKTLLKRKVRVFSRWTGQGSFLAPIMCGSTLYPLGERVFFRIKVQITGATLVAGAPVATSVKATYESYRRTNRTKCVPALGHDAALYTGTLVTLAPPPPPPPPTPVPPAPTPAPG